MAAAIGIAAAYGIATPHGVLANHAKAAAHEVAMDRMCLGHYASHELVLSEPAHCESPRRRGRCRKTKAGAQL